MTTAGGVHGHVHSHSANNKLIYVILLLVAYCLLLSFQHLYEMAQMSSRKGKYYFSLLSDYNNNDDDDDDGGGGRVNPSGQKYFNLAQSQPSYINLKINALDTKVISNIDFLIMVPSSPENFDLRDRIRRTWGSAPSSFRHKQVFFFFGRSENRTLEDQLVEENHKFGDVIQADFLDSYNNLTLKTLSMLYWVHFRISSGKFNPKWIMKCDDDNEVDIFRLEDYLHTVELQDKEILCCVREDAVPSRVEPADKWFVGTDLWKEPIYPKLCFGPAYFVSPKAVPEIIRAHEAGKYSVLPLEDVYVTGILAKIAKVSLRNYRDDVFTNYIGSEKMIIHSAAKTTSSQILDSRWEEAQVRAFGYETLAAMKAIKQKPEARTNIEPEQEGAKISQEVKPT